MHSVYAEAGEPPDIVTARGGMSIGDKRSAGA